MNQNEIQTVFEYNAWAFERIWECVSQLSDKQFVEEIDYSTGSLRNIIVHIMSANSRWASRLQNQDTLPHLAFEDFDTLAKTKAKWSELKKELSDYINSLDEEQLNARIHWEIPTRGWELDNPRWEILLHVANHATDHRAQILAILHHHFHVKTVEQDMILFLADRKQE